MKRAHLASALSKSADSIAAAATVAMYSLKILRALSRLASTPVDSKPGNRVKAYTPVYTVKLADCGN